MPWNTPGDDGQDDKRERKPGRSGWQPNRSGGGGKPPLRALFDRFRGVAGGPAQWIGIALALWLVLNCFVLVPEQQRGVVLRFGQFARILQPGPHLKLPWPIERVRKVVTTQVQNFNAVAVPVLTTDENIVNVDVNVQYVVSDPVRYLFGTRDADEVLKEATLSAVREQVGRAPLDTVLSARSALATAARTRLQGMLDAYSTGLSVSALGLPNARPPDEVKPAFDDVNSAQQDKDRRINEAEAYAAKVVPEARGEAAKTRAEAIGYRTAEVARATGDAQRFELLLAQYKNAPDVTRKRLWLETVQDVLASNRKVVGGDGRQLIYVPMPAQAATTASAPQVPVFPSGTIAATVDAAAAGDTRPERGSRAEESR